MCRSERPGSILRPVPETTTKPPANDANPDGNRPSRRQIEPQPPAPEDAPPLTEHSDECWVCVRIARRYLRLGRTLSSALAVAGGGGVALTFLVASPDLRADQWLAILLLMQFIRTAQWACVWMAARKLNLRGFFPFIAPITVVLGLIQSAYSIAAFPNHAVMADSSTWWWLVADGAGWAFVAVLVRELFFVEKLEEFPTPRMWGPGSPDGIQQRRGDERRHAASSAGHHTGARSQTP